jgi:hypothetical protein
MSAGGSLHSVADVTQKPVSRRTGGNHQYRLHEVSTIVGGLLRAVKRKMSNYQLKRAQHRSWPQPTMPSAQAIGILPATLPGTSCRSP